MGKKDVHNLAGVIFCCHGGSCTRAGARTVEKALRLHARETKRRDSIRFVRTACTGLCKSAPIVIICANTPGEASAQAASTCGAQWQLEARAEEAPALMDKCFGTAEAAQADGERSQEKRKKGKRGKKKS